MASKTWLLKPQPLLKTPGVIVFLVLCTLSTSILLGAGLVGGLVLALAGGLSPFAFCGIFSLISLTESCSRPYTTNILLEQSKGATGAAASLINFTHTVAGCIGMFLAVLPWHNSIVAIGGCEIIGIVAALVFWVVLVKTGVKVKGIQ